MLTKEERELLARILNEVKIFPLEPTSITLIQMIQSIARKVLASEPSAPSQSTKTAPKGQEFE